MSQQTSEQGLETARQSLLYEKDVENRVATITLNRPEKMNAPDTATRMQFAELLHQANVDDEVKVLVIRGVGEHLGTGADLPEMLRRLQEDPLFEFGIEPDSGVKYPPQDSFRSLFQVNALYASSRGGARGLQEFKKISIVEVKGYCYGWHFYQAADADIVISADDALFGHAAFRYLGWGPRMWTWIETMGLRQFQEMLFTGRPFTADEMRECGFINRVVARQDLEAEVEKYAMACAHNGSADRIVMQKAFLEIYKQQRGEYMGSMITSVFETLGHFARPDGADQTLGMDAMKGDLAKAVKSGEARIPPEWRLSVGGRRNG
ncbi:MAG TPA: enoyl-CoA hydratase/isomerase family protein [Novosphingobium sp.]|nr:enoyl-CoA hydratase/isomerase family protein [Novosphingobium sp.]HMP56795.1 enoyl-CoA hydratase/isomerase family protein [Novosphingobium sp.]